jgi:hypothetical protein
MVVVRRPGKTRGALGFACPFFWFFFLGKQKKRTNELAEGTTLSQSCTSLHNPPTNKKSRQRQPSSFSITSKSFY